MCSAVCKAEVVLVCVLPIFLAEHHMFSQKSGMFLTVFCHVSFIAYPLGNGGVQKVFIETCAVCRPRQRGLGNKL